METSLTEGRWTKVVTTVIPLSCNLSVTAEMSPLVVVVVYPAFRSAPQLRLGGRIALCTDED